MKAEELRIGNWVQHNPEGGWQHERIRAIGFNTDGFKGYYVCFGWARVSIEDVFGDGDLLVEPILLTDEWLEKFGFEDNSYAVFVKNVDQDMWIGVSFHDYAHTRLCESPVNVNDYSVPLNVKYVHQLQNLYYALTGEELTIKEI